MLTRYDYTYDKLSRPLTADGQNVANSEVWAEFDYAYDALSRLTVETVSQPGILVATLSSEYDLASRRIGVGAGFTANSSSKLDFENEYTHDGLGRITSVKQDGQTSGNVVAEKYITFEYNELDQLTEIVRFADLSGTEFVAKTDYDRDYLGRLTQLDTYQGATHFATYDLEYDAASRITAIDSVFSNSAWNEDHDFTYDDNNQLTAADHSVQNDEGYAYDKNGNRTGNQTHLGATTSTTVIADNRISTDGVYNYTWDDEGNMATKTKISNGDKEEYTWDYRNRLSKITFKNSGGTITKVIEFRYDHNNLMLRRIETPYTSGSPGTPERDILVHDGDQIVLAFHKSGSGTVNLTNRYLWGPEQDLLLADEQVTSLVSAGTAYWAFLNQVGSVVDLATYNTGTDTTSVVKHRKYDEFGNVTSDSAPGIKQRFAFTGKWFEESFGATWHIFRWYDTFLGKWKGQDPIKDGLNWSAYVENSPVGSIDPDGRSVVGKVGKAVVKETAYAIMKRRLRSLISRKLVQVHHILYQKLFDHKKYGPWLEKLGIEKDCLKNVVPLPTPKGKFKDKISVLRTAHGGGHLKKYFKHVDDLIDEVFEAHKARQLTDDQAVDAIRQIQGVLREQLKTGQIQIHDEAGLITKYASVMFAIAGMSAADQEAFANAETERAVERIDRAIEQPNLFHIGRMSTYTGDEGVCGWVGWGVDLFNPGDDIAIIGDLLNVMFFVLNEMYPSAPIEHEPRPMHVPKPHWSEGGPTGRIWRIPGSGGGIPE